MAKDIENTTKIVAVSLKNYDKFDISRNTSHDLLAYIYIRFANNLIYFPFQGNRTIDSKSIKKAEKLNKLIPPYKIKKNFNKNFFIDIKKQSPIPLSNETKDADEYLKKLFKTKSFITTINKIYDDNVYNWAKEYSKKSNYFPLTHGYSLLAIAKTIEYISLNDNSMKIQQQ